MKVNVDKAREFLISLGVEESDDQNIKNVLTDVDELGNYEVVAQHIVGGQVTRRIPNKHWLSTETIKFINAHDAKYFNEMPYQCRKPIFSEFKQKKN